MSKKMTIRRFSKARRISAALFCMSLSGKRNLSIMNANKVSRALETAALIWRVEGFSMARTAAWVAYQDKHNGDKP
jgi:hypothetical protein